MTKASREHLVVAIEKAALELIAEKGFAETPADELAEAAGISRRTFFRYFPSKSDILFGNFDVFLRELEDWLSSAPGDKPVFEVIADAVMRFNRLHTDGPVAHRQRMELILHTPALRANAALRNDEWQAVLARYAARRLGEVPEALGPQLIAHASVGASHAAYEQWLGDESSDLDELMHRAFRLTQRLSELTPTT